MNMMKKRGQWKLNENNGTMVSFISINGNDNKKEDNGKNIYKQWYNWLLSMKMTMIKEGKHLFKFTNNFMI